MLGSIEQNPAVESFQHLDVHNALNFRPSPGEVAAYGGRCVVGQLATIETPPSVLSMGEILTNPTQIELELVTIGDKEFMLPTMYVRRERGREHLGTSRACKYAVVPRSDGTMALTEIAGFSEIPGEDPRRAEARMRGHLGVHEGELLSVVKAPVDPDNPQKVKGPIQQIFYFAPRQSPHKFEPIAVGPPGAKCTTVFSLNRSKDDTGLGFLGRPHPTLSYGEVSDPTALTPEAIESAMLILGLIPTDSPVPYHIGSNLIQKRGADRVRIGIHQAWVGRTLDGLKILNYRLAEMGFKLPSSEQPRGRIVALGVTATAAMFDRFELAPKEPEGDVGDYGPVLYGSVNGHMVSGIGDNSMVYGRTSYIADERHMGQIDALRRSAEPPKGRRHIVISRA